ncbi:MAG TPA: PDZ domain-containing protein, partial [Gammaproteobacteria bacterium]|nr:PDZ domain-containing protein [Gammaproteobacteria bacterium]
MRIRLVTLLVAVGLLIPPVLAWAATPAPIATGPFEPLKPNAQETRIAHEVVKQLQAHHYNHIDLDASFSRKLLNFYLNNLDGSHSVFLASEVNQFRSRYGGALSRDLKQGDLWPAFTIYNTYEERRILIDKWLLKTLSQSKKGSGLNLSSQQTFNTDREHAPWPKNEKAQEALWTKRLENRAIELRLKGLKRAEVRHRLMQRYREELNQIRQDKSMDAFMAFMDAYTHSYDPHTDYFSPERSENFKIDMRLSLQGIGAEMRSKNDYAEIVRLVPGGPAAKSGQLQPADRIVAVGQGPKGKLTDVVGMRLDKVVQLIRGPAGSTVRLEVMQPDSNSTHIVTLTREHIQLKDQAASKHVIDIDRNGKHYKIGVVTLPSFYIHAARDV